MTNPASYIVNFVMTRESTQFLFHVDPTKVELNTTSYWTCIYVQIRNKRYNVVRKSIMISQVCHPFSPSLCHGVLPEYHLSTLLTIAHYKTYTTTYNIQCTTWTTPHFDLEFEVDFYYCLSQKQTFINYINIHSLLKYLVKTPLAANTDARLFV